MLALLGLLAVAGYQNRDKIGAALNNLQGSDPGGGLGGVLGNLAGGLTSHPGAAGGGALGGVLGGLSGGGLAGGLGQLLESFKSAGHADVANSWVQPGVPTQGLTPDQVQQAIGEDNLAELSQRTGLTREELLQRLATSIPKTIDTLTPGGQMPTEDQIQQKLLPSA